MCGILGTINVPFDASVLDLIRHRGPDDSAIWQRQVGAHRVMLGHRRLSIVDLSPAGRQPMSTAAAKHCLVSNGEVYNHLEVRKTLGARTYRGHSDTETILYCLAERGIEASRDLNGIFAFGLVDEVKQTLYLARDPFGVKPLYYWASDDQLIFSSEIRPIQALLNARFDIDNVAQLLRLRYLPAPDTLFQGIRKVLPGHSVEVRLNKTSLRLREVSFAYPPPPTAQQLTRRDALAQYGELVNRAVDRQLMSDVPVGVLLSGGIDSALVAGVARSKVAYRMKAFTVGFNERAEADEVADARQTAETLGLDHHHVRIGFTEFLSLPPRITAIVEEPLATTSMLPMFFLAELASRHVKVVLSGQGADESMGGYRRYQAELLRPLLPNVASTLLQTVKRCGVRSETLQRIVDSITVQDDVARFESVYSVFSHDQIQRLIGHTSGRAYDRITHAYHRLDCANRRHSVERMMSIDLRMNLADDLLLYTDKITMHHSVECRVPLLDLDLVSFVESLPASYKLGPFRGKLLHKRYAERILPSAIVHRKKKGFLSPTREWFKKESAVRDILLDPGSCFARYFNLQEVRRVFADHDSGLNRERHIFLLLGLYYWMAAQTTATPAAAVAVK